MAQKIENSPRPSKPPVLGRLVVVSLVVVVVRLVVVGLVVVGLVEVVRWVVGTRSRSLDRWRGLRVLGPRIRRLGLRFEITLIHLSALGSQRRDFNRAQISGRRHLAFLLPFCDRYAGLFVERTVDRAGIIPEDLQARLNFFAASAPKRKLFSVSIVPISAFSSCSDGPAGVVGGASSGARVVVGAGLSNAIRFLAVCAKMPLGNLSR